MSVKWNKIYRNTATKPYSAATKSILEATVTHAVMPPISYQSQKWPLWSFTDKQWVAVPQTVLGGNSENIFNVIQGHELNTFISKQHKCICAMQRSHNFPVDLEESTGPGWKENAHSQQYQKGLKKSAVCVHGKKKNKKIKIITSDLLFSTTVLLYITESSWLLIV